MRQQPGRCAGSKVGRQQSGPASRHVQPTCTVTVTLPWPVPRPAAAVKSVKSPQAQCTGRPAGRTRIRTVRVTPAAYGHGRLRPSPSA